MFKTKAEKITEIITSYFEGIYSGNVEQLGSSFHQDAFLYGDIKGSEYAKSLKDYLEGVRNRKSPQELQEENKMEIVSLEILGDISMLYAGATLILPLQIPVALKFLFIVTFTGISCFVFYEFTIRRIKVLRPLFGMKLHRKAKETEANKTLYVQ